MTGDLNAGNIVNLVMTVSNAGPASYADTVFGEVFIPAGVKRQIDVQLTEPRIQCEAYRGTHDGLAANVYSDVCRVWFFNGLAAGTSKQAVVPIKLLNEGDYKSWEFTMAKTPTFYTYLDSASVNMHVLPAVKTGGGGTGIGTGTGTALPDLQMTAKASSGSPAAGRAFTATFTVRNSGKGTAATPVFTATVAAGVSLLGITPDAGGASCSISGQTVTCTALPDLAPGGSTGFVLALTAPNSAGNYALSGSMTSVSGDATVANNSATVSVTVK
ncbi:MAG: DUF11 domain-containing protein [Gemmatimonadaceae bacterium]|nr:DUF11 domain-containing protein [Gemmatimonadaceae bacterium]